MITNVKRYTHTNIEYKRYCEYELFRSIRKISYNPSKGRYLNYKNITQAAAITNVERNI
jgi:hypothetical protein